MDRGIFDSAPNIGGLLEVNERLLEYRCLWQNSEEAYTQKIICLKYAAKGIYLQYAVKGIFRYMLFMGYFGDTL